MEIGYTPEQEATADASCASTTRSCSIPSRPWPSSRQSHAIGGPMRRVWKQMCADGWAGIGWPEEYGGQGRSAIEQFVFFDESMRAGAPVPMLTINTVGPDDHALRHRRAEASSSSRRSSPATSTSASATPSPAPAPTSRRCTTRAVRDGDEYVINGQKMWTSLAGDADYCWLAVRTNPEVEEAQGHLADHRADGHARHHGAAAQPARRPRHQPGVLRRRARPGRQTSSAARTTVGRSSPTSSTTSASRCARAA